MIDRPDLAARGLLQPVSGGRASSRDQGVDVRGQRMGKGDRALRQGEFIVAHVFLLQLLLVGRFFSFFV